MTRLGFASCIAIGALGVACAQLQGLDGYEKVDCVDDCAHDPAATGAPPATSDDGGARPADAASGDDARAPALGWAYRRAVTLTSDAPAANDEPVLVVLPPSFDVSHAKAGGDDLRFSTTPKHEDDLTYFVESWTPGGPSQVWVRVPTVPAGASTIYAFYGKPSAPAASSFEATFPKALRTAGGGAGSFTPTGDIDVDWFELRAGDTLTLPAGAPLAIRARRVILAGVVDGTGRGYAGGSVPNGAGGGPGGGGIANPIDTEASGGGGYGGSGGHGGEDVAGAGGPGGGAYGTATGDDIAMGSGGAGTATGAGGAGGGAVSVIAWRTTITGLLRVDGAAGGGGADRNGGGGAGGGILLGASFLDLTGATLSANGGGGGNTTGAAPDGGGGGAGGRIKLRRRAAGSYVAPASVTAAFGSGGAGGGTTAPGATGGAGTIDVNEASTLAKGVEATVGDEEKL